MNVKRLLRRSIALFAASAVCLLPRTGFATTQVSSVTISYVSVYAGSSGSQGAYVAISPAMPNGTEGCATTPAQYVWIDFVSTAQPDGKTLYATVMAAFLTGHTVTFGVSGCGSNGMPLVYRVDLNP